MKSTGRRSSYYLGWLVVFTFFTFTSNASVQPPQTCVPPPSGMVSWWPADGNALDIASGNNGTLHNGATFAPGMVDQAFSLDGVDDHVRVEDNASLRLSKFTLDAWINAADVIQGGAIIAKTQATGNWLSYMIRLTGDGNVELAVENRAESRYGHWRTLSTLTNNTWFHVAANWQNVSGNSSDAKIYINGVEQAIEMNANQGYGPTFTPGYTTEPLFIGRQEPPVGGYFEGLIDEVEIYDRVLSTSEIQAIYSAGAAGKCKDADSDGVPDTQDDCPNSIVSSTVVIGDCDSGVPNTIFPNGCTISDRIQQCAVGAPNHGQFVSCVAHLTNELKRAGIITGQQKGAIQSCAAQSNIP